MDVIYLCTLAALLLVTLALVAGCAAMEKKK